MHQNRFRLGLRPDPAWGTCSAPPDPLAGFKGPTCKGREGRGGKGREGEGNGEEGKGGEGKGRGSSPKASSFPKKNWGCRIHTEYRTQASVRYLF